MSGKAAGQRVGGLADHFPVADAIAALFAPHVEVVVHDFSTGLIAHLANSFSGRSVGDSSDGSEFDDEALRDRLIGPYRKVNPDGRNLRSMTAVLRSGNSEPIGMMCINFDVSMFERLSRQLSIFAFVPESIDPLASPSTENWRQAIERMICSFEAKSAVSASGMDAATRRTLIEQLDQAGLLAVRHAPQMVATRLGISRASLYSHLKVSRENAAERSMK